MKSVLLVAFGILFSLNPVLRSEDAALAAEAPAAAAEGAPPETEPPLAAEEPANPRPRWLERAQKAYAEGLKASGAGDDRTARRKLSQAVKALAEGADGPTFAELRERIAAALEAAEGRLAPPTPPDEPPTPATLEVTEKEMTEAPPAPAPPVDKKLDYAMPMEPDNPEVKKLVALFTTVPRHRNNLQAAFNRMALHRSMVLKEIKALGLPRELVYLPLVESEYQIRAVSRAGAVGLWQFMPMTGRSSGLKINYWIDERLDPDKATRAALKHLKDLYDWFQSWPLALAAYNRGIYGLQRDLASTRSPDFSSVAGRGGLPQETEHYVPKFMAMTLIGDNAAAYGFAVPPSQIGPTVDELVINKPLDLAVAAKCAETTEANIRDLNPVLRLWCTPKNEGDFTLRLPRGSRKKTEACLAETKEWTPAADVIKYRVKRGDYLGRIASRHKTTVAAIMKDNRITSPKRLRMGQVLRIRPGRGFKGE